MQRDEMKKPRKRLNLNREQLLVLTPQMLSRVAGASDSVGEACTDPGENTGTHCTLLSVACPVTSKPEML